MLARKGQDEDWYLGENLKRAREEVRPVRSTRCEKHRPPEGKCRATDLVVDLAGGHGGVAEVFRVAVGQVEAAGGGDAIGRVVDAAGPAGVVVHAAAAQLGSQGEEAGERQVMRWESNAKNKNGAVLFLPPVSECVVFTSDHCF